METREDESVGSLSIMSSLEFAFQSRIEEAAVGCFGNLNIFLSRPQLAYDSGTSGAPHSVCTPPFNLEILLRMGIVGIEHGDGSTTSRVYEFAAAWNHRDSHIAFDLAINEVAQHVHDKYSVPSVIVVNMGKDCGF